MDQLAVDRHPGVTDSESVYGVAERLVVQVAAVHERAEGEVVRLWAVGRISSGLPVVGEEPLPAVAVEPHLSEAAVVNHGLEH